MPLSVPELPAPVSEEWDWQLRARCRNMDTNLFFPRDDEGRGARARRERVAKAVCARCPVLQTCRLHAFRAREPFGVWGGTTEGDRTRSRE
ncbi:MULTISPECIES: WhiB family transcriptional regulator [unclassified Rhodococcus (in: high G+C Gram-positive bacteria)]|uniref:WhiB family transcriptional regulator n=1 Tax=unclassified Rhodococcus (in: high G+C Gram-positive bacteria) TaxID=192944 RepID=UPI000BE237EF|nr:MULTISPECIES: WhiB family transcriptional regulator [unclassified Rhodococcus (in: high G+C Gram-positive bacteria)]